MSEFKRIANAIHQLEYNVNLKRGIIYLEGEIDTYSSPFFLERVNAIRDLRKEEFTNIEIDAPIDLYITSPGGDINGLTALVDLITNLKCKINTIGIGHVESAAVWVLAAGTGTRYVTENVEIMVHETSSWLRGTSTNIEADAKQVKTTQNNLFGLLEKFSKKDSAFWESEVKGKNLYLSPQICIEYGLADELVKASSI